MSTMVWDEAGARYYETGVSKGIFFDMLGNGVPWNGLVSVSLDPSGGEPEHYYFDGIKYMDRVLAEDFQATIQSISTPKEFEACEGVREYATGVKTSFNKRDKFNMSWRTEIGSDAGEAVAYKLHVAYNCLVQPSSRNYQTVADTTSMDVRSFVITATPACGRHSYFWFDSREYDLSLLEAELYIGNLPKCWELKNYIQSLDPDNPIPPSDDDCLSTIEDLESYNPGQIVDEDKTESGGLVATYVYGQINNGLGITELPAVGAFAANDSAASEVGTGDILADDDDLTYITSADGDLGYTVGLSPLVGYVDGAQLELHIRMSISGGVNPDDPDNLDADAQVHISTDATGDNTIGGFSDGADEGMGFSLSDVDGTPVDYVVPLDMDAWVDSGVDDVVAALSVGAYLNVVGATNNNLSTTPEVRVYEMSLVMVNATDPDKYLRTSASNDNAVIEQHIYESGTTDQVASHTIYEDFKIIEIPDLGDVTGSLIEPVSWSDIVGTKPGVLKIQAVPDHAYLKWYDPAGSVEMASLELESDIWYTARIDWSWTDCRIRVYKRDESVTILMDSTNVLSRDPVTTVKYIAGKIVSV